MSLPTPEQTRRPFGTSLKLRLSLLITVMNLTGHFLDAQLALAVALSSHVVEGNHTTRSKASHVALKQQHNAVEDKAFML
jgi:hypothetical protein